MPRTTAWWAALMALVVAAAPAGGARVFVLALDEGSGRTARDASGRVAHLRDLPADAWVQGKAGGALRFDGRGYLEFEHDADLAPKQTTVRAWIKVTGGDGYRTIVDKPGCYRLFVRPAPYHSLEGAAWINGYYAVVRGAEPLNDRRWHLVEFVYDGERMQVRLDGHVEASLRRPGSLLQFERPLRISSQQAPFHGLIDEVAIFDTAEPARPSAPPQPRDNPCVRLDGKPFFPIGLYGVPPDLSDADMAEIRDAGFNLIQPDRLMWPEGWRAYLDRAHTFGLKVIATLWYGAVGEYPKTWATDLNRHSAYGESFYGEREDKIAFLKRLIPAIRDHPALAVWDTVDEIAQLQVPLAGLLEGYNLVKDLDPNHPVWVNHASATFLPDDLRRYNRIADVIGCDIYPIPASAGWSHLPDKTIACVGDYTELLRRSVDYAQPVWMVLQAWRNPRLADGRYPTARELRFMTYDAVVHGTRGVVYFVYQKRPTELPSYTAPDKQTFTPEFWRALKAVAGELKALMPYLTAASSQPVKIKSEGGGIAVLCRRAGDALYLIAANERPHPARGVTLTLPQAPAKPQADVLFEDRTLPVKDGTLTDDFEPYAVHVYRL